MSSKHPKDKITLAETSEFVALAPSTAGCSVAELIRENVGQGGITPADLQRIKVPAGGGLAWAMEDDEPAKEFEAVILAHGHRRAYWQRKFDGANVPPDCWSSDAEIGLGMYGKGSQENPHGFCAECRMSQFNSSVDDKGQAGKGQACQLRHVLMLLRPTSLLPIVLSVPPSSLKEVKNYLLRLVNTATKFNQTTTRFSLKKAKSSNGIEYSQIVATKGRMLEPSELSNIEAYVRQVMPAFQAIRVEAEEASE
jgi:hypothetical protein